MMIKGSPIIVTLMHDDGKIDYEALGGLVDFHIERSADAVAPAGTTGESATLDFEERCQVVECAVR